MNPNSKFPRTFIIILIGIAALGLLVYACATSGNPQGATPTPAPSGGASGQTEAPTETDAPAGAATATQAPADEPTPTPAPTEGASVNAVVANDQAVGADNTLVVARVTAAADGWIVIHADTGGAPGAVLGYAQVKAGENDNVKVTISDPATITPSVWAMLHIDAGTTGTYEFPGADIPVVDGSGNVVMMAFNVTK